MRHSPSVEDFDGGPLGPIDLNDANVWERATPHEWFTTLRSNAPVCWHPESDGPGYWAVTGHDLVREISTSPDRFSSWVGGPLRLDPPPEELEQLRMVIIGMDPPEHRTFRGIVSKAFTPKMISNLETALKVQADRVFGNLQGRFSKDRSRFGKTRMVDDFGLRCHRANRDGVANLNPA